MWYGGLWGVPRGGVNSQYITHIIRPLPSVPALKQAVSWQFSLNVKSNEKLDMCRTALVAIEFEEGEGKFKGAVAPPTSSSADARSSSVLFSMCFISVAHFFLLNSYGMTQDFLKNLKTKNWHRDIETRTAFLENKESLLKII